MIILSDRIHYLLQIKNNSNSVTFLVLVQYIYRLTNTGNLNPYSSKLYQDNMNFKNR